MDINALLGSAEISMYPCRGKNVKTQVNEIFTKIPGNLFTTVWIKVVDNKFKGCGWEGFHWTTNCEYVTNLVKSIQSNGKKVGIYTSE